jgi:AcrR family transcriptional regulator
MRDERTVASNSRAGLARRNGAGRGSSARPKPAGSEARRVRDPEAMRRRILDAATQEFAAHGYGGARVERISQRARTVDRSLYYYFGSKEGLFRAVLEDVYEKLGAAEQALDLSGLDPEEGMRRLIAFTWDYYVAHPEFIRLLNTENLHKGEHLRGSKRVKALAFPLLSILTNLLERGAGEGRFRHGTDPVYIYVTIAALGYFYLSNRHTLSRFLGRNLSAAAERKRWLQHITGVVLDHLRP